MKLLPLYRRSKRLPGVGVGLCFGTGMARKSEDEYSAVRKETRTGNEAARLRDSTDVGGLIGHPISRPTGCVFARASELSPSFGTRNIAQGEPGPPRDPDRTNSATHQVSP